VHSHGLPVICLGEKNKTVGTWKTRCSMGHGEKSRGLKYRTPLDTEEGVPSCPSPGIQGHAVFLFAANDAQKLSIMHTLFFEWEKKHTHILQVIKGEHEYGVRRLLSLRSRSLLQIDHTDQTSHARAVPPHQA
jgi:hypothetical protein